MKLTCAICARTHDPAADPDQKPVTTTYRSIVLHIPPTPLGLLPERWTIEHWCNLCRQRVTPAQLITHAQDHEHDQHSAHRLETA
ncbi:MAG: hypothetical protein M3083_00145 [Actinomycetota bacterium]|nr:hypothetical protein [Actinomycetota bacterium]